MALRVGAESLDRQAQHFGSSIRNLRRGAAPPEAMVLPTPTIVAFGRRLFRRFVGLPHRLRSAKAHRLSLSRWKEA
jgi:hypothetical protein